MTVMYGITLSRHADCVIVSPALALAAVTNAERAHVVCLARHFDLCRALSKCNKLTTGSSGQRQRSGLS